MKYFYILLLLALPSIVFAQSNYHEGYVIKSNGDTVKGFIDYREWDQSPTSVDFRMNKDDKQSQTFNPENSKGFEIDSMETYVSYNGLISWAHNNFPDLDENLDTSKIQAAIFLKLITSGKHLLLYSQTDERKTRYFVAERNEKPVELKYEQYYNDRHDAIERPLFRGQLLFYINKYIPGNASLIDEAQQATFQDETLERIIYKINGDTAAKVNGHIKQSNFRGFLGIGLSYAHTKNASISGSARSAFPQFSIGFDRFENPNVQQRFLRVSISLAPVSVRVAYPISGASNNFLNFDQFTIAITPQVIYNVYNKNYFKVFIGAGLSFNSSSYSNLEFSSQTTNGINDTDPNSLHFSTFWVSFPLQTGVMINKRLEASFMYAPYTKISPGTYNKISNQSLGLGVKVFLND